MAASALTPDQCDMQWLHQHVCLSFSLSSIFYCCTLDFGLENSNKTFYNRIEKTNDKGSV